MLAKLREESWVALAHPSDWKPTIRRCEHPGCGAGGNFGHHELIGKWPDDMVEHWFCSDHQPKVAKQ
jgi:hypothetical protein